ncbi:NAD(+) synthetase [bacterium DOLJORAL78_65_58]|nr:MAG: NAD(+) synthetase [bacterium DOLZORAL124_64_63]PIE75457.1 MAG: NAD(+) synthetase [bacterium DOLJORAL78_65_58]
MAAQHCGAFIKDTLERSGLDRLILGLSGGIDSAVSAGLAVRALGPDKVRGVMMPYTSSSAESLTDALAVAQTLGMETETVNIAPMADAFLRDIPADALLRRGNIMARCRMVVLYDCSARDGALVLGTGNRTESLLGYTTLFGDSACALNPLARLYKTEVRLLSAWLGLPDSVLTKAPSADLWPGQSDEQELGFTYTEVDELLHAMVDRRLDAAALRAAGFAADFIRTVSARVRAMAFKRQPIPVAEFAGRLDPDPDLVRAQDPVQDPDQDPDQEKGKDKDGGFH